MKVTIGFRPVGFVVVQFGLIFAIAWYAGIWGGAAQNLLMAFGVVLGLWAIAAMRFKVSVFPEVHSGQRLYAGGPYQFIRHPMYTAVLLTTLTWVSSRPDIIAVALWLLLLADLLLKLRYEEQKLSAHFPEYAAYMHRTKRLIPFVY